MSISHQINSERMNLKEVIQNFISLSVYNKNNRKYVLCVMNNNNAKFIVKKNSKFYIVPYQINLNNIQFKQLLIEEHENERSLRDFIIPIDGSEDDSASDIYAFSPSDNFNKFCFPVIEKIIKNDYIFYNIKVQTTLAIV